MCLITLVCSLVLGISIPADSSPKADSVLVVKSERKLKLIRQGEIFREYSIALGSRPVGHKWQEGDDRTPEGYYVLDWRNPASRFYRSIHVSYPDDTDESYARMAGVNPGGNIMIHGLPNDSLASKWLGWDWTDGCIAVTNDAMDEIWNSVDEGTPIEIRP